MAKGFTVKAKTPPKKEGPEWDYAKIKDRMKGKTVVSHPTQLDQRDVLRTPKPS